MPPRIDFALAGLIAAESLVAWAPLVLGPRIAIFRPGEARWWPNRYDSVHVLAGPPPTCIGDWSGRWRRGDRWGTDLVALVAEARRCRPG